VYEANYDKDGELKNCYCSTLAKDEKNHWNGDRKDLKKSEVSKIPQEAHYNFDYEKAFTDYEKSLK